MTTRMLTSIRTEATFITMRLWQHTVSVPDLDPGAT